MAQVFARRRGGPSGLWLLSGIALLGAALAGCAGTERTPSGDGKIAVVAAENFWGSLAAQLGGAHVRVTSIISSPAADPHSYEAKPEDARQIADAAYVIVNGAGYDTWATKLLESSPSASRITLDIAAFVGKKAGDNEHVWYGPGYVRQVIDRITADYKRLDPTDATTFDQLHTQYLSDGLKQYNGLISDMKAKYAGAPVGATESIFVYLSESLELRLLTPPDFMRAVAEGEEPTVADKVTVDQQITGKQIKILVYNVQNDNNDVKALVAKAQAAGIPVVKITETPDPGTQSFQDWQARQLETLKSALALATEK